MFIEQLFVGAISASTVVHVTAGTGIVFGRVHAKRSLFYNETRHLQDVQAITSVQSALGGPIILAEGNRAYFLPSTRLNQPRSPKSWECVEKGLQDGHSR